MYRPHLMEEDRRSRRTCPACGRAMQVETVGSWTTPDQFRCSCSSQVHDRVSEGQIAVGTVKLWGKCMRALWGFLK